MNKIKNFQDFCSINESSDDKIIFKRHYSDGTKTYGERAKRDYGLSDDPGILSKMSNFFQRMENKINDAAERGKAWVRQNRASRPYGGPNTGVELLFGGLSLVPNILKRVFAPTKYEFTKKPKNDEDLEFLRHTNEDFSKNELPKIKTEDELADNISDLYYRGGVSMGESRALDDIARNRVNMYYQNQINPRRF